MSLICSEVIEKHKRGKQKPMICMYLGVSDGCPLFVYALRVLWEQICSNEITIWNCWTPLYLEL